MNNATVKFPNGVTITIESASAEEILAIGNGVPSPAEMSISHESLIDAAQAMCEMNKRIHAIKMVRGVLNLGLREAKDWVDSRFPYRGN